jgi:hypothetical protein
LVEIIEICLVMSRSQSDTERFGKLAKDVSEKRFGGKLTKRIKTKIKGTELIRKHLFMVIQFHSPSARRSEERIE